MAKGSYTVGEAVTKDSSFRSCLCALLIFIALCVIILLVGVIKWKSEDDKKDNKNTDAEYLEFHGNNQVTPKQKEKMLYMTTATDNQLITTKHYPTTISTTTTTKLKDGGIIFTTYQSTTWKPTTTKTSPTSTTKMPIDIRFMTKSIQTTTENEKETTTENQNEALTTENLKEIIKDNIQNSTKNELETTTEDEIKSTTNKVEVSLRYQTGSTYDIESTTESISGLPKNTIEGISTASVDATTQNLIDTLISSIEVTTKTQKTTTETAKENNTEIKFVNDTETTTENPKVIKKINMGMTTKNERATTKNQIESTSEYLRKNTETTTKKHTTIKPSTTSHETPIMEVLEATGFDIDDSETSTELIDTNTTTIKHEIEKPILTSTTKKPEEIVCLTSGCKSVASRILSLMNHSIDPCEDFYEFACGGMQVDNDNSEPLGRISEQIYLINDNSPQYLRTFKNFYDSCVSHEYIFDYEKRISQVRKLVTEVGTIRDHSNIGDIDMTDVFAKLTLRRSLFIMEVKVDIDKETSKFMLNLGVPQHISVLGEDTGHSVPLTDKQKRCLDDQRGSLNKENVNLNEIHEEFVQCQKDYTVFFHSIETAVKAFGFYSHFPNAYNVTQAIKELGTTIEWDVLDSLNELPHPRAVTHNKLFQDYTIQKISDLQKNYPYLEWKRFFKILTNIDLDENTLIGVYFPNYFKVLFKSISRTPKWKINNALIAMYSTYLYEHLVTPISKNDREKYCLQLSTRLFRDVSSNLYMRTWSNTELDPIQKLFVNIFDNVKNYFVNEVSVVEWLDRHSKDSMLNKAKNMTLVLNKKDDIYNNDDYLNEKYAKVNLNKKDYAKNVIEMIEFDRKMLYNITGELYTVDRLWSYFVNAFDNIPVSFYTERLIMAPLGMMKGPVKGYPRYITMSRIGLSLAREIGHHFDPVGIQNDMVLSPESKQVYDEMVDVALNDNLLQATNKKFKTQNVLFNVASDLSVNERISDNTGLNLITNYLNALKAENTLPWISTTFSKEKIFFISVAQDYCQVTSMIDYMLALYESEILPPSLRVENIVTNSEAFAEIFSCPEGSHMNNNPMKTQFPSLNSLNGL
ncbi:hypothetical protein FQR65_LT01187 [Abscondita terminalis]|nr:hypothetical protein FQR65_LT01187 [Abscondita terminalis]